MLILGYRVYMDRYSNSLCYKKTKNDRGHEAHRPRFRWPGSHNLSDHNRQFELPSSLRSHLLSPLTISRSMSTEAAS